MLPHNLTCIQHPWVEKKKNIYIFYQHIHSCTPLTTHVITYRALHGQVPAYIRDLPHLFFRSSEQELLPITKVDDALEVEAPYTLELISTCLVLMQTLWSPLILCHAPFIMFYVYIYVNTLLPLWRTFRTLPCALYSFLLNGKYCYLIVLCVCRSRKLLLIFCPPKKTE